MDELNKRKLQTELNDNNHELFIMTPAEYEQIRQKIAEIITLDNIKIAAGYAAPTMDLVTAAGQVKALGANGRVVEKVVGGRRYIILKGYPGLRKTLRGTRYLANNPKIVSMAIGKVGVGQSIIQGAKLTIFLTAPINVVKFLVDEQFTLSSLIGTIATDLVKIGVASALGAAAAVALGAITTIAAGPLVAAIFVGVATSILLEKIDAEFGLTNALIKFVEETSQSAFDRTIGALAQKIVALENIFSWQAKNNIPVGKGILY